VEVSAPWSKKRENLGGIRLRPRDRMRGSQSGLRVIVADLGTAKENLTSLCCDCSFPMKRFCEKSVLSKIKLACEAKSLEGLRNPRP
jgi:hypothetical protein